MHHSSGKRKFEGKTHEERLQMQDEAHLKSRKLRGGSVGRPEFLIQVALRVFDSSGKGYANVIHQEGA